MSDSTDTRVVAANYTGAPPTGSLSAAFNLVTFGTKVVDTHGSYSAGLYTVRVPGYYDLSAMIGLNGSWSLNQVAQIVIQVDGVPVAADVVYAPGAIPTIWLNANIKAIPLNAGQVVRVMSYSAAGGPTFDSAPERNFFSISRVSGPSAIAASESVSALYTGSPPTGTLSNSYNTVTFGTKVKDTHGGYSGGSYTVPISGSYDIAAQTAQEATYALDKFAITAVAVNGTTKYKGVFIAGGANSSAYPSVNIKSVPLVAGDVVTIKSYNDATTPTFTSDATTNWFSIVRTGN
jgi:hypothetical protein